MGKYLATLSLAGLVGGCSLIYNPNSIDKPVSDGATVDVEVRADANPMALDLAEIYPPAINEGAGTGGSRKAVVVLKGHNFVTSANLAVTILPMTAGAVTLDAFQVAGNSDFIALELTAPVDETCNAGTSVPVSVTVEQDDGGGGRIMRSSDALAVTCLDELKAAPATSSELDPIYSVIEVSSPITFAAGDPARAILRSASSITLGTVNGSASGIAQGPGGGRGGAPSGSNGEGLRPGSGGGGALGAGGGGAGFVVAGTQGKATSGGAGGGTTGDVWISDYATNASSGGGAGAVSTALAGGAGGGGGGTIEITAPGNVTVGAVTADGAAGAAGSGGGPGGDGSGGVVILRSAATLTASTVSVATTEHASANGQGISSAGRVRVDAAAGDYPAGAQPGPMFVGLPTITDVQIPSFMLRGAPDDASATVRVLDKVGNAVTNDPYHPVFGTGGSATVSPTLKAGYNKVCVFVTGGTPSRTESSNCYELAYLPP